MIAAPNVLSLPVRTALPAAAQSLAGAAPAQNPQETFMGTVGRNVVETAVDFGDVTGKGIGGMTGLASITVGLYAGVAGGALFLGLLGGGLGPVVAATSTHGLLQFAATSFKTAGFFARTGMVLGGAACGVGGFRVGNAIGHAVGEVPGMLLGAVVGAGKGVSEAIHNKANGAPAPPAPPAPAPSAPSAPPKQREKEGALGNALDTAVSGIGLGSGLVGGAMIGAGVASAHSLVAGLLAHSVTMSALSSAGIAGAVIGGVTFGAMGLVGGATLSRAARHGVQWVYDKAVHGRNG